MPSPIPSRLLPRDLYPAVELGTCSSPLAQPGPGPAASPGPGATLQVPAQRFPGRASGRPWSSVIQWKQLRALQPVGSGGFGSVYRAEYLGRTVALKNVKKCSKNALASRQSFWAELNAAHLSHPNIVRVLAATTCVPADFGDEGSLGAVLMEFVGSSNLQQVIYGSPEELPPRRWLRYAADIARGLDFLHAHRVLHLDVKPANVLLSARDACKLVDFGCSVKLEPGRERAAIGAHLSHVCGTYTHRAPELLRGDAVSSRADVFSFGITLWQLATREPPYAGDRQRVLYAVVAQRLRPPLDRPAFGSERGRSCAALLRRCWSAEARDRPGAPELVEQLSKLT
uniref:non-specific serine/threonine protein kinase n=1 Tax=Salarias fasciatus TaxID=181472 RepID=A0A672JHJ1_SALFA